MQTHKKLLLSCSSGKGVYLELKAGEAVLLHNWLLHRSDTNSTDIARRAFSVCYMDVRTQASNGDHYTRLFEGDKHLQNA